MTTEASAGKSTSWRIAPSGDSCLVVEIQSTGVGTANEWAAAAAVALRNARLPGITDVVPAMVTVGIHYRPESVIASASQDESPYGVAARAVAAFLDGFECPDVANTRVVSIPVCYGGEYGPDLETVAGACGLAPQALIDLHAGADVRVQMLGFAPGHPYIGTFDARMSPPRLPQPRTSVPAGSVGLANRQSVIYPFTLPGGWNLIGRTPLQLFDPGRQPACLLQAGDRVRFVSITADEFQRLGRAS